MCSSRFISPVFSCRQSCLAARSRTKLLQRPRMDTRTQARTGGLKLRDQSGLPAALGADQSCLVLFLVLFFLNFCASFAARPFPCPALTQTVCAHSHKADGSHPQHKLPSLPTGSNKCCSKQTSASLCPLCFLEQRTNSECRLMSGDNRHSRVFPQEFYSVKQNQKNWSLWPHKK